MDETMNQFNKYRKSLNNGVIQFVGGPKDKETKSYDCEKESTQESYEEYLYFTMCKNRGIHQYVLQALVYKDLQPKDLSLYLNPIEKEAVSVVNAIDHSETNFLEGLLSLVNLLHADKLWVLNKFDFDAFEFQFKGYPTSVRVGRECRSHLNVQKGDLYYSICTHRGNTVRTIYSQCNYDSILLVLKELTPTV